MDGRASVWTISQLHEAIGFYGGACLSGGLR